jgi:hypothetical protein
MGPPRRAVPVELRRRALAANPNGRVRAPCLANISIRSPTSCDDMRPATKTTRRGRLWQTALGTSARCARDHPSSAQCSGWSCCRWRVVTCTIVLTASDTGLSGLPHRPGSVQEPMVGGRPVPVVR